MVFAMLPGFLLALYEKHGQPLEVVVRQIVECCFIQPKERPYQTNNAYKMCIRDRAEAAHKGGAGRILLLERDNTLGGILNQCIHNGFGLTYFKEMCIRDRDRMNRKLEVM